MSAMEPLSRVVGVNLCGLSLEEKFLLEADLYLAVFNEIIEMFRLQRKEYFRLLKLDINMENTMIELEFVRLLIQDILESQTYNMEGIARYTHTPEDVIYDLILKSGSNELMMFPRRLIELHRSIRPELYRDILNKIVFDQGDLYSAP